LLQVNFEAEMSDEILWNEIGNIYLKFGSPKDAITAFTKAVELNSESGWGHCSLGNAYLLTGEFGHALFEFRKSLLLMDTPENQSVVWNKIGDAYRALKDIENAIQAYKKADALDMGASPVDRTDSKNPGGVTSNREIVESEISEAEKNHLFSNPEKSSDFDQPSIEAQAIEDGYVPVKNKIDSVEPVTDNDPTDTKPINFAIPKMNDEHVDDSQQVEENKVTSQKNREMETPSIPREKPLIVIPEPNSLTASPSAEKSIYLAPQQTKNITPVSRDGKRPEGRSKVHSNIGPGTDDLEEILAKVNIYENITRVNPTSDRGWDTLGKLYKALGRYKDAIGAYQKAIEVAPDKEVYYYYLGLLFSVEQQNEEAIQAFQFVLRKNPDYVLAHSALAGVYHRMGLENKANHHISIALPKMNNESTYNRACFYVICGDHELAFEFLRLALLNRETTIDWIKSDPDLDPIRDDQRYLELISGEDQPTTDHGNDNYFSSELEGKHNKLLPILNHSLTR
jgi:tetratricopeptide (TPR) repeat protein